MGPTGDTVRVLQVHPSRFCNLRCLHCYSTSAPSERGGLPIALLRAAVSDAAALGYNVLGVSGGEPILYRPLPELLDHARACGLATTVTSNGMLLDARRLERIAGRVTLLAISLDGEPTSHDRIRGRVGAFREMACHLEEVRRSQIPFGFIFTLTQHNLDELDWVARFAVEAGAKLLQIHPLELAGRAATELPARPDEFEAGVAFLEAQRIRALYGDRLEVQLDLVDRDVARQRPAYLLAGEAPAAREARFAELVSPLVVEADGSVVPLQYGLARHLALGNLHDAPLGDLARLWRASARSAEFRKLCRRVFTAIAAPSDLPFVNWYERVGAEAAASALA